MINDHLSADHVKDAAGGADNDVLAHIQLPHVLPVDQGDHSLACFREIIIAQAVLEGS